MLPGFHLCLDDQVHFVGPLCAYVIFKAVVVCEYDDIFSRGIKPDASFAVQVIDRVVEEIVAVSVFSDCCDGIQVYNHFFGCPETVNNDLFIIDDRLVLNEKKQGYGNADDTKTYHKEQVLGIVAVPLIDIGGKTKCCHNQPDTDADIIASDVLFFKKSVSVAHLFNFMIKLLVFYRSAKSDVFILVYGM